MPVSTLNPRRCSAFARLAAIPAWYIMARGSARIGRGRPPMRTCRRAAGLLHVDAYRTTSMPGARGCHPRLPSSSSSNDRKFGSGFVSGQSARCHVEEISAAAGRSSLGVGHKLTRRNPLLLRRRARRRGIPRPNPCRVRCISQGRPLQLSRSVCDAAEWRHVSGGGVSGGYQLRPIRKAILVVLFADLVCA